MNNIQIISLILGLVVLGLFLYKKEVTYLIIFIFMILIILYPMMIEVDSFVDSPVSIDYIKSRVSKL